MGRDERGLSAQDLDDAVVATVRTPRVGLRSGLALFAAALLAIPFTLILVLVTTGNRNLSRLDQGVADRLQARVQESPLLLDFLRVVSVVTTPNVLRLLTVVIAVLLVRQGRRALAAWLLVTMAIGGILGVLLKQVVVRARPEFENPAALASGYSFPSGHALNSMLFAGCILVLVHRQLSGLARWAAWAAAAAFVLLVGFDRIALGVHYVSDVVAGWVVALATLAGSVAAFSLPLRDADASRALGVPGRKPPGARAWWGALGALAWRLVLAWAAVAAVLVALGLLLTSVLGGVWPLSSEDDVSRALEAARTPGGEAVTNWLGRLGNTEVVVGFALVAAALLRAALARWREALLVVCCTLGQSLVFLTTTLVVDRERPDVAKLDEAPPTSSFPSGHTSAALGLYVSLAIVVSRTVQVRWLRRLLVAGLCAVPVCVASARLYRGMHHPSDVAGSAVNAALVIWTTDRCLRAVELPDDAAAVTGPPDRLLLPDGKP